MLAKVDRLEKLRDELNEAIEDRDRARRERDNWHRLYLQEQASRRKMQDLVDQFIKDFQVPQLDGRAQPSEG